MNLNRSLCVLSEKVEEIKLKLQPEGTDVDLLDRIDKAVKLMLTIESKVIEPFITVCDYETRPPSSKRLEIYDTTYEQPLFSGGRLYYDINGEIITTPQYEDYLNFGDVIENSLNATVKDMIIQGQTIGGYNQETGQTQPFISSCESEGNILKVKSLGKNIFDRAYSETISSNTVIFKENGEIEFIQGQERFVVEDRFKANTQYSISFKHVSGNPRLSINYTDNTTHEIENGVLTSEAGKTISMIRSMYTDDTTSIITELQLEENTIPSQYEPYKEYTSQIQLPNSLKKFDYYNSNNGEYVERTKTFKIDGNSEIQPHKENGTWISVVFTGETLVEPMANIPVRKWENNYHVFGLWWFGEASAGLSIEKSKLATPDFNGAKDWILNNPIEGISKMPISRKKPIELGGLNHKTIRSSKSYILSGNKVAPTLTSCKVLKEQ